MTDSSYIEKRGAQALLATYLQLTQSAGLAQQLHRARTRSMEKRLEKARDDAEHQRLLQRLEAQASQGEAIESTLQRLRSKLSELASFAEAGLTMEDFRELGLDKVVSAEDVDAARKRREPPTAAAEGEG
jgi:hypothetical protein